MPLTGGVAKQSAKIKNNTYHKLFVNKKKKKYDFKVGNLQTLGYYKLSLGQTCPIIFVFTTVYND